MLSARHQRLGWQAWHSVWVGLLFYWPIFSWTAILYIGLRTRTRKWILAGLVYAVPCALNLSLVGHVSQQQAMVVQYVVWGSFGLTVLHALLAHREYYVRVEAYDRARREAIGRQLALDYPLPPEPVQVAGPRVDVNTAGEEELATVLGPILAKRAVQERRGGFASMAAFARALGLKPRAMERLAPRLTLSEPEGEQGRVVDY